MKKFGLKNLILILPVILISGSFTVPKAAALGQAALNLTPSTGTFVVDSTFDVPIFLDTAGQSVNALELTIKFPPDKLQLVSSSTGGKSIIGIWPTLPKFNNQTGTVELTGGIPNGIVVSKGLVSTLTFRAKTIGSAVVKIEHNRVLGNDGSGTEIAIQTSNSLFQIILPPPAGPIIVSDTHPDQNLWYKEKNVSLKWGDEGGLEGFSYMVSDVAVDLPDDISEGISQAIVYKSLSDGRHYFHIKGLRNGQWGGVSHYSINIDASAPAGFKLEIIPRARTTRRQPVIQFATTDATSGISHYEFKLIPLQSKDTNQQLFIEATSPYVTAELPNGGYDAIVRAYDEAGNFTEATQRIDIVPALLRNIGEQGLELRSTLVVSWWIVWSFAALIILLLLILAYFIKRHHDRVHHKAMSAMLPDHLQNQLSELQMYRDKYGKVMVIIFAITFSLIFGHSVNAQSTVLTPPLIKTVNKNLANDELFYAGGFTSIPNAEVILFLQNLEDGETLQINVKSDKEGEWFYRHDQFLPAGNYLLWGQSKISGQLSPPTGQIQMTVDKNALQFGSSKISLPTLYLVIILALLFILLCLAFYILLHYRRIKHKRKMHHKHIQDAEASIKRGFAVLNRDIQAELALINQSKFSTGLSEQERMREEQLIEDLHNIEQHLSEEIWELEEQDR